MTDRYPEDGSPEKPAGHVWKDEPAQAWPRPTPTPPPPVALPPLPGNAKVYKAAFRTVEPVVFSLEVEVEQEDGTTSWEEHRFSAQGDPGVGGTLAISGLVRYDPRGRQSADLNAINAFFERVLLEDGYERLLELEHRRDVYIDWNTLGEIFNDLLGVYSGRTPTQPSISPRPQPFSGR